MKGDLGDAKDEENSGNFTRGSVMSRTRKNLGRLAADLYRKRAESQSDDGALLAGFGLSLVKEPAKTVEVEKAVLRQAVRVAPGEWRCRVALGRFLITKRDEAHSRSEPPWTRRQWASLPRNDVSLAQYRMDEV